MIFIYEETIPAFEHGMYASVHAWVRIECILSKPSRITVIFSVAHTSLHLLNFIAPVKSTIETYTIIGLWPQNFNFSSKFLPHFYKCILFDGFLMKRTTKEWFACLVFIKFINPHRRVSWELLATIVLMSLHFHYDSRLAHTSFVSIV